MLLGGVLRLIDSIWIDVYVVDVRWIQLEMSRNCADGVGGSAGIPSAWHHLNSGKERGVDGLVSVLGWTAWVELERSSWLQPG